MTSYPKVERRLHAREFVLKDATIVADNVRIACSVRNQHEHGAELRVDPNALIPERFLLDVPADAITYRAVARWRRNERLGVQLYANAVRLTPQG
ncbi:PilZ domain-containing protein [Mesorhizobium sp. CU2]|uniref:PilZ domain-containing protein n=1 Tax=unclassified Mesorhizobium TaxID=325217 RepID=UPI00112D5A85|nr:MULTISPECIES: PilZ domain-containing protein [unclassified Mesorhizobium]TPN75991.1 PilZ domain-containing protein [Mesorhizobium sp. CU3]TPO07646.1 PilZ domain-containing protein [Mesorhizobium sp. CU2]